MLMEVIIGKLGMSIAETLLNVWLKEKPIMQAISTSMFDILKNKTDDYLAARKVSRQFENIADKVGESLLPVFQSYELEEESLEWIAAEVGEIISSGKITEKLLANLSYNHTKLYKYLLNENKHKVKDLSSEEEQLYSRCLDLSAQYILDLAPQLPKYTSQNFTEILSRFERLSETIYKVLDDLEALTASSYVQSRNRQFVDFERDYRAAIARKFDFLDLLGVDVARKSRRYQLSIAYVALDVNDEYGNEEYEGRMGVEEALMNDSYSCIVGEAGTGKTTLLRWLAVNSATKNLQEYIPDFKDTLPFIIELRRYTSGEPSIDYFIKELIPDIYSGMPENWIIQMLESGKILLLVDGLDEIPSQKRNKIIDWIEYLIGTYKLHIIITSRPGAKEWDEIVNSLEFKPLFLAPMSINHIKMFIDHWHMAVIQDNYEDENYKVLANKLYFKLQNNIPILRLASNPLLCAMLCALHYDRKMQLPSDRSELYEACCSMLLERRDAEREIALNLVNLSYKQKRVILNDLAYWMLRNGKTSVSIQEAIGHINPKLENMNRNFNSMDSSIIINDLIIRSGIIREPNYGVIDFIHRTFQEYMAANAASSEGDWGLLINQAGNDLWQETIILAAGFTNIQQADNLIESLLSKGKENKDDNYHYDLLAMACLETATEVSLKVRNKVTERIKILIPPKDNEQCKALAATGDLAVSFLEYREGYSTEEKLLCINTISMISSRSALSKLASYLNKDIKAKEINSIKKILSIVTPQEVYLSNLYQALLGYIINNKRDNSLEISGIIIDSLMKVPLEELKNVFSLDIKSVNIKECTETSTYIIPLMDNLDKVTLDGEFTSLDKLHNLKNLKCLDIRNYREWPSFSSIRNNKSINNIRILSSCEKWPNLKELQELPNLHSLSIYFKNGLEFDFSLFDEISNFYKLKKLHLCCTMDFDLDVSPIAKLSSLEQIKISTYSRCLPQNIITLEELKSLKKVIVCTDVRDIYVEEFIDDLKMCLPECSIEHITGWKSNVW
ncbi:TPA: NACHT domain-containing protein [Clostridium botulinum]|nr:NACHT domain-containing protein [Clostridium botulinum]